MGAWTEYTGRTEHEIREVPPSHCPAGHLLKAGTVLHGSNCDYGWFLCRACGLQIEREFRTGVERIVQAKAG